MKSTFTDRYSMLVGRILPILLGIILIVPLAHADLTLPCAGGTTDTYTYDDGDTVSEDIFAVPAVAGDVFWELSAFDVACVESSTPDGPESYTCPNGATIALPTGAPGSAISSAVPVTLAASPISGVGSTLFSLTATLESDPAQTCQKFIEVDVLEPADAFDIVFVLDRSGSMNGSPPRRWDALEEGVKSFLPFLSVAAQPPTPSGSRFGMTLFAGSVLGNPLPSNMIDIDTATFIDTVEDALDQDPSGSTAMGSGLQDAMDTKLTDATRPRVIVLFTDGEQNQDPHVTEDGCGFINPTRDLNPPPGCSAATSGYKIITTGIGSPSGSYLDTLTNLAAMNRGASLVTNNGTDFTGVDAVPGDIGATFAAAIQPALSDLSPQQVAFYTGLLLPEPNAPGPVVLPGFDVNRKVDNLILSVSFSRRFETPQLAQLLANIRVNKDGTDVTGLFRPILVGNFSSGATLVLDFDNLEVPVTPEGNYVVSLNMPSTAGFKPDLEFRLTPYVDDHRLDVKSTLSPGKKRVNAPIEIAVQLDWFNQGIEDADVIVRAYGPDADMGEVLSEGDPIDPTDGTDPTNAGIQKYDHLAANDPAFLDALKLSPNSVAMTHQGNGLYTGSYPAPDIVGVVHFVYNVSADAPRIGKVQRTWYESAYVRFDSIDMDESNPGFTQVGDMLQLDITPVRPSGKLIGPGALSGFRFTGVTLQDGRDNQDGSYRFTVDGGNADTPITVTLLGDKIYEGPADWSDQGGGVIDDIIDFLGAFGLPWWLVLLIILIILFLILKALRGSTP